MFRLKDTRMLTDKEQEAVLLFYGLSSPYHLIDEQPFLSKRQWMHRFKVHHRTVWGLERMKLLERNPENSVRLTADAWRLVEKVTSS